MTGGSDALGDVVVQLDVDGRRVTGRGVATDVVEASARAYLAAINRALQMQAAGDGPRGEVTSLTYRIGVIRGDGTGPEVVAEALKVLRPSATASTSMRVEFDLGADRYLRTGETLPDDELDGLRGCAAILLGAVGDPRVRPGILSAICPSHPLRAGPIRQPPSGDPLPGRANARAVAHGRGCELRRRA